MPMIILMTLRSCTRCVMGLFRCPNLSFCGRPARDCRSHPPVQSDPFANLYLNSSKPPGSSGSKNLFRSNPPICRDDYLDGWVLRKDSDLSARPQLGSTPSQVPPPPEPLRAHRRGVSSDRDGIITTWPQPDQTSPFVENLKAS